MPLPGYVRSTPVSDTAPPPQNLPPTISGITVGERVRESGPIAVHKGEDSLGLAVRLYFAEARSIGGETGAEAMLARVRLVARVEHAELVPFTTAGRKGDLVFAVAKELGARSVDELLGRGGALAVERAAAIAVSVAGVLAALEKVGARHGDLTPRRILLPGRGQVAVRGVRLLPAALQARKARYQAPEEARGADGDIRSDIFVLGLIVVEMLTGRSPVLGSGREATRALAAGQLPPAGEVAPAAPEALREVLARMLAIEPVDRFATAAACHAALEAAARGESPPSTAPLQDDIPTALPLDDARPETAPIDPAAVRAALTGAGAAAPPMAGSAPPAAAGPPAVSRATTGSTRRGPGRLLVESRLGEALVELDETMYVGWLDGAPDVTVQAEPFDGASLKVTRDAATDSVEAMGGEVTVNGNSITHQELVSGDVIAAPNLAARYERSARGVLRATRAERSEPPGGVARAVSAIAVVGSVAVLGFAFVRLGAIGASGDAAATGMRKAKLALTKARDEEAAAIGRPGGVGAGPEAAARRAFENARAAARRRPDELDAAQAGLRKVAKDFPGTAYGKLAEIEADNLGSGNTGGSGVEAVIADAEERAAEGGLDKALLRLRNYAEDHLDTVGATVARRAAVRLQAEMDARVAADFAKFDVAMSIQDYRVAMRVLDLMAEYVPLSVKDTVLAKKANVTARINAVLGGGGTTSGGGDEEPGGGPPDRPVAEGPTETQPESADGDAPPDEVDPEARDAEALTAFRAARRFMDSGKDREALQEFVEFLRSYKDTPTGAKYDTEIRRRITSLAAGPAGVEEIFRGKVERRDRGRFRITYDFEDADQLLDFRDINAFEAPPRADWTETSGAARAKGSGALMLDAHFKPEFLSVQVEIQPERAHDLGLMFFEAGEPRRYYLYTLQNSFFKLGKGDGRADFRENAIALFGPDMWRDTPPGEIGFVRKCGSEEPKFRPGEPVTIKCGKAEGEVWMRFPGGRTIRGSAYGDTKYEFKGLSPALFVVNSAGSFDKMVVEGIPDPDWVARRWSDLLDEL